MTSECTRCSIQKSANFAQKEVHKQKSRDLFKTIKKLPSLKEFGGENLNGKNLIDRSKDDSKTRSSGGLGNIPQLSQAVKLKAYMKSVSTSEQLQEEFEQEFEVLVVYIIQINLKTEEAFGGVNTLDVKDIINSLIKISNISSSIEKNLRIVCLKVIRKVVELENKKKSTPASTWDSEDWINF